MSPSNAEPVVVSIDNSASVSGLMQMPQRASACLVLAHGAGAGMTHPFMAAVASELADRSIATLRYQFPIWSAGASAPIRQGRARGCPRHGRRRTPTLAGLPLFRRRQIVRRPHDIAGAGGGALPGVRGLVFLGFPLHPAGRPSQDRAKHLFDVTVPMLFLQGTRDALASLQELEPLCKALGARATLTLFEGADHSFHVPARSGRTDAQVRSEMLDALAAWINRVIG